MSDSPNSSKTDVKVYSSSARNLLGIYADQGEGKSCLLTSLPVGKTLYVSDVDGGFEGAQQMWGERGHPPENLTLVPGEDFHQFHKSVWNIPPGFDFYAIDTYTTAMTRMKKHVMALMNIGPDVLIDWWKIGGKISSMAIDYFENWREKVHQNDAWGLVMMQEKLEGEENPKVVPDLVGQARRAVAGTVNGLFHLEKSVKVVGGTRKMVRQLRTRNDPGVLCKDRSLALDEFEPADLSQVIEKIEAHRADKLTHSINRLLKQEEEEKA